MTTIVCGVDGSPGDRRSATGADAEQVAAAIVADVAPTADVVARGVTGDVTEGLAEVARAEGAGMIVVGARRGRSRAFLRARGRLAKSRHE